jgi:hypothetical protein
MDNQKLKIADKIVELASEDGGFVYGEFVREVIVPRNFDLPYDSTFKTVNLCFRNYGSYTHFANRLRNMFYIKHNYDSNFSIFGIKTGQIANGGPIPDLIFKLDSMVSENFISTIKDFDVNQVAYIHYVNLDYITIANQLNENVWNDLIDKIKNKCAFALPSYIFNPGECENLYNKYISKGWKIFFDNKMDYLSLWLENKNITNVKSESINGKWVYSLVHTVDVLLATENDNNFTLDENEASDNTNVKLDENKASDNTNVKLDVIFNINNEVTPCENNDILRSIFLYGMQSLNDTFNAKTDNEELRKIFQYSIDKIYKDLDEVLKK